MTFSTTTTATPTALLSAEVVRLMRASHGIRAQIHAANSDGLEWAGSMLLFHLCKDGPQRSSALAAAVCVDPSTVSRQIGDLVELGLVERRADPHDGRATLLAATAAGEARYQELHERRDRAFALMLADWSDHDVYVCGSPAMVETTVKQLLAAGVPEKDIRFEEFGQA